MSSPLIFVLGLWQVISASCGIPPNADVHVIAQPDPISIDMNFRLDQIASLASEYGGTKNRRPLGFYVGTFLDRIVVSLAPGTPNGCARRVRIEISLQLTNRHIAIGHELEPTHCLSAALEHYQKKAAADEAAFLHYADALGATMARISIPPDAIGTEGAFDSTGRRRIDDLANDLVEESIEPFHKARIASQKAVDTAEEMRRLSEACQIPASQ